MDLIELHGRIDEAREEYDACPVCGEDFIDVDGTVSPSLVFIHEETDTGVKGCDLPIEEDDR